MECRLAGQNTLALATAARGRRRHPESTDEALATAFGVERAPRAGERLAVFTRIARLQLPCRP